MRQKLLYNKINQLSNANKISCRMKSSSGNKSYSNTIFLPKTKFPLRLESKKLIERDDYVQKVAEFERLYKWQRSHLSEPEFVLHDGPPYANGRPHMGHAINKILKDTIIRGQILKGNKVHYIPGWDCHGLPIELKAIANSHDLEPLEIRKKARNFATETVEEQQKVFKSWGIIGDWKHSYKTYSVDYVKTQLRLFFKLYKKNLVYRDKKPIHWSPTTKTALAEAELEYNENHKSPSVYLRVKIKTAPRLKPFEENANVYALVWTTTPWTLPANHAICFNNDLSYSLLRHSDSTTYIVATDVVESVSKTFNCSLEVVETIPGYLLEGATYIHPIYKDRVYSFLNSSHATACKGTGLVHTAGSHGPEDFLVALNNKLELVNLVDDSGCYNDKAGENLTGKYVLTEGNASVLNLIKNDILHLGEIRHSYPYDWRTRKPVIIKASEQWFLDTNVLKTKAIELLDNVTILPGDKSEIHKKNLVNQLQKRPYWCISRQRKWGVPIPVFYDKNTSETVINENTINHHCYLLEKHGTDFWWQLPLKQLIPENLHSDVKKLVQGQDIMDIWLDSGFSWAKVLEGSKVADMYLEGIDQITGWFQSSLLTSVALREKAPYKSIYVHGYAVDEGGVKMSKSLGNVVDPVDITNGTKKQKPYGVDVLRWWVTCHANNTTLASVSPNVLQSSAEEVQKIRSVLRFALGCLSDYEPSEDYDNTIIIDKYMLHVLYHFHEKVEEFRENYQFHKISSTLLNLLTNEISALYYTAIKDRVYCEHVDSSQRRAAQYTLLQILEITTQAIAPMLPLLVEEIYLYFAQKTNKSYFTSSHAKPKPEWNDPELEKAMNSLFIIKKSINKELATSTIEAEVTVTLPKKLSRLLENYGSLNELAAQFADIFQVSKVQLVEDDVENHKLSVVKSRQFPCPRCRRIHSEKEEELCKRCYDVVNVVNGNKTAVSN